MNPNLNKKNFGRGGGRGRGRGLIFFTKNLNIKYGGGGGVEMCCRVARGWGGVGVRGGVDGWTNKQAQTNLPSLGGGEGGGGG